MESVFVNKRVAAAIVGLDPDTLKTWRENQSRGNRPCLIRGIHWVAPTTRSTLYNRSLLIDFVANIHEPALHEIAIENFLASLPSSQAPVKSRAKNAA
jgi:hypothetical protein